MKYLIFAATAVFAAQGALAQSTTPADPNSKPVVNQPAPATGASARNVGTTDKTFAAEQYNKAQEKRKASNAKKAAAKGGDPKAAADGPVRPGSLMTEEERTEHRKKLQTFKTLDECQKYQQDYQATVEARAKEQHKTLRPFNEAACSRYKLASETTAAPAGKVAAPAKPAPK
ncbi:MAG TPA: hypothetical protein VGK37_01770 [Casimicrobiaceae bacterium]